MGAYIFSSRMNLSAPMVVKNLVSKPKSCRQQLSLRQLAHNVHIAKRARLHPVGAGKTRGKSDGR
jgi:hypothetical protein